MAETNGSGNSDRLGPIERILEAMAKRQAEMQEKQAEFQRGIAEMREVEAEIQLDVKILFRSQVVMGELLTTLTEAQKRTEQAQQRTEESLEALIRTVDEVIRGRKND